MYTLYGKEIGVDKRFRPWNAKTNKPVAKKAQATKYNDLNTVAVELSKMNFDNKFHVFTFKL